MGQRGEVGATGWAASLQFGALNVPLTAAGGGWAASKWRWELSFTVPQGTPERVYALVLGSDSTATDTAMHAVKVLRGVRQRLLLRADQRHAPARARLLRGHQHPINAADTSGMADFDAVIEDLNVIHPEFIIHTGDLVNEGELEEYLGMYEMGRAQAMLNRLRGSGLGLDRQPRHRWLEADAAARRLLAQELVALLRLEVAREPARGRSVPLAGLHLRLRAAALIGLEAYINNGSYDHYRQDL